MRSDPSIAPDYSVSSVILKDVTAGNGLVTGLSKLLILFTKLASGIEAFRWNFW
jgi:hypothetical protein